jgi:hypothetical protein
MAPKGIICLDFLYAKQGQRQKKRRKKEREREDTENEGDKR